MIVDPDFLDHWKTRMLVGALDNDEVAPLYVIRLWAHCQNRRQSEFDNVSTEALKALCHFPGQANKLESSLVASGFIRRDGKTLIVIGWDYYNSTLVAAWANGKKGGRPSKKTQRKPVGFENTDLGKPVGLRLDRIGLDKIGSEHTDTSAPVFLPGPFNCEKTKTAFGEWFAYLARRNKTPVDPGLVMAKAIGFFSSPDDLVKSIDFAIANGYVTLKNYQDATDATQDQEDKHKKAMAEFMEGD